MAPDHEWSCKVYNRGLNKCGCPFCNGKKPSVSNCLAIKNPEAAAQWHPTKNKNTPFDVTAGSGKSAWFICPKGHDYFTVIRRRSENHGCPVCCESKGEQKVV